MRRLDGWVGGGLDGMRWDDVRLCEHVSPETVHGTAAGYAYLAVVPVSLKDVPKMAA